MYTFGCEVEGMVDNSETVIESEEYTHICDKDLPEDPVFGNPDKLCKQFIF